MTAHINKRRLVIRLILLALLVLLCFGLRYVGKDHEVLLDNKTATIDGREYQEIAYLNLIVDGNEAKSIEFYAGDRDVVQLRGPKHTLKIQVMDEDTEEVLSTTERTLDLGTVSSLMISLPAVAGGAQNILLPLPQVEPPEASEDDGAASQDEAPGVSPAG